MIEAGSQPIAPKPKLRWFQDGLRTLLVLVTLCAFACSWLGVKLQQAKRQREAVTAIEKVGGSVVYEYQFDASGGPFDGYRVHEPLGPKWLRNVLGVDFFNSVLRVYFLNSNVTDAGLKPVRELTQVQVIHFSFTQVTDAGLEHLLGLNKLRELGLQGPNFTDAGLAHLRGLSQLQFLHLADSQVTDAGLEHLHALTKLQTLSLFSTKVTDEGVKKLQHALPNCKIYRLSAGEQIRPRGRNDERPF